MSYEPRVRRYSKFCRAARNFGRVGSGRVASPMRIVIVVGAEKGLVFKRAALPLFLDALQLGLSLASLGRQAAFLEKAASLSLAAPGEVCCPLAGALT